MTEPGADRVILHASTVAVEGRGLLILGPSGAGKSSLALQLLALGAQLIADDRTEITVRDGQLIASCPASIAGRIEARGLGILSVVPHAAAPLCLAVDLGIEETARLPPRRSISFLRTTLALVLWSQGNHFPSALMCYLKGSRAD